MALISKRVKKDSPEPALEPAESQVASIPTNFLGTRTMDVASANTLHPVFQAILNSAREVKEALADGIVNEREAAVRLNQLRARDNRGALWTVGLQSLLWYRRIGNSKWVSSPSPLGPSNDDPIGPWYAVNGRAKKESGDLKPVASEVGVDIPEATAPKEIGEKPALLTQWHGSNPDNEVNRQESAAGGASTVESGSVDELELEETTDSMDDLYAMIVSSGIGEGDGFSKSDVLPSDESEAIPSSESGAQLIDKGELLPPDESDRPEIPVTVTSNATTLDTTEAKTVKKAARSRAKKAAVKEVKSSTEVVDFTEELE